MIAKKKKNNQKKNKNKKKYPTKQSPKRGRLQFQFAYPWIFPGWGPHKATASFPKSRISAAAILLHTLDSWIKPSGLHVGKHRCCFLLIIPCWEAAYQSEMGTGPIPLTGSTNSNHTELQTSLKITFILPCSRPGTSWLSTTYNYSKAVLCKT